MKLWTIFPTGRQYGHLVNNSIVAIDSSCPCMLFDEVLRMNACID